jgi:SAM-dependent methyltransferase
MPHEVFDAYAERYDRWFEEHRGSYLEEMKIIGNVQGARWADLEVGVGTGRFAAPLGIRLGIDPSRPMLLMARARGVEVIQGVAEALPFKDGSLGSVVVMTSLCYFDHPWQAFREIYRVLAPGGRIIIGFLGRGGEIVERYRYTKDKGTFLSHATFYTPGEITRMLGEAGFSDIGEDRSHPAFKKGFHVVTAKRPYRESSGS